MPRIFLILIILAVILALIFGEAQFLFETKIVSLWGKEINLNSPMIISGLAVFILLILLLMGLIEKIIFLFKTNRKAEKKKEMAIKE